MSEIQVTLGDKLKTGQFVATGYISVDELVSRLVVDTYDPDDTDGGGYQRLVSRARVKELARRFVDEGIDVPTSILVNIRSLKKSDVSTVKGNFSKISLNRHKLHVVDGQHRAEAYKLVLEQLEDEEAIKNWKNKLISVVFLLGVDQNNERAFFHDVNGNAKSIPSSYLQELISKRAEVEPEFLAALNPKEHWKINGDSVMKTLNNSKGVWKGKIKFPGSKAGTIPNSGFVNTLKPLLMDKWFGQMLDEKQQAETLMAYWEGMNLYFKQLGEDNPFESPKEFSIQKRIGVAVLHSLILPIKEYMNEDGTASKQGYLDPKVWLAYQKNFLSYSDTNTENIPVRGADFWRTGRDGAVGKYSSGAGTKALKDRFEFELHKALRG